ncbi:hypothetical protein [Pantoea sp. KPR_PJ]|uniref:hypothetical protein n=1 Tax=Pantoea sp. KPR_PJ TaxID=2738375 RepID=UPI00352953CD
MSIDDDEKLTNVLMGEAVMALLAQGTPVHAGQVVTKLREMAATETRSDRREACERAIIEVLSALTDQSEQQDDSLFIDGNITLH